MERIISFTSWMTNEKATAVSAASSSTSSSTSSSKTKKIQSNTTTPRTAEMGIQVQIKVPTMLAPTPTSAFMPATTLKSKTKHTNTASIETQTIQNHELISYTDDEMIGHYTHKVLHTESKPAVQEEAPASDEPFTCCVCLDTLSLGNPNTTFTSCGHAYHLSCLLSSLSKKNLCPMCRGELEETRPKPIASNVLRPVNAEQIIRDELYWFPKSAYIQNIRSSSHPRRAFKESMRTFAYAVLQSAAEFVHEENVPEEWYSEEDTDDESNDSNSENENENENSENENESESENENSNSENDNSENDNDSDNDSLHNQQQDEDEFNYAEQLRIRTMGVNPLANRQSRPRLVSLHGSEFDLRDALP